MSPCVECGVDVATVKVTGVKNVQDNIRRMLDEVRKDPQTLAEIANVTVDLIQGTTRSGKSLSNDSAFPPLSKTWQYQRDHLLKYNAADEYFLGSSKSNLTFTGQLINSIKARIFPSNGTVEVGPQGQHQGYKTKSGNTKAIDNKKLFEYLEKKGRGVFNFGQSFKDRLSSRVNVLIKRTLRTKILKSSK